MHVVVEDYLNELKTEEKKLIRLVSNPAIHYNQRTLLQVKLDKLQTKIKSLH